MPNLADQAVDPASIAVASADQTEMLRGGKVEKDQYGHGDVDPMHCEVYAGWLRSRPKTVWQCGERRKIARPICT